jgi:Fibronectin type III domain
MSVEPKSKSTQTRSARFFFYLPALVLFSLSFAACPLYNPAAFVQHPNSQNGSTNQTGPDDISMAVTQATLEWDPPTSGSSQVANYTLSYRVHGNSTWTTLATVPASATPSYTVLRSSLQPSTTASFDFEVVAVSSTGVTSPPHTSLDSTADPTSGWYLTW